MRACLVDAILVEAVLRQTDLTEADLTGANLQSAMFVETRVEQTKLSRCSIYGLSAWNIQGTPKDQRDLIITHDSEPTIRVDSLQIAQFIYLLLNNSEIRNVIDTITSKVVVILGRFTSEYKAVLDELRDELRARGWIPLLFDFDKPNHRNLTETVRTLAHMARFIIADISDAKSIPQELYAIVPHLPSVPIQPLLASTATEYGMFESIRSYPWVLPLYRYADQATLLASLQERVITPAVEKARELHPEP